MDKARVYVDLNEMVTDDIVLLSKEDTKADNMGNRITFYEGLPVSLYSDDESDSGEPDNLIFEGTAIKYDLRSYPGWQHVKWCARIDWNSLMHESECSFRKDETIQQTAELRHRKRIRRQRMKYRYIFVDLDNTLLDFEAAEEHSFYHTAKQHGLQFGPEELARYQAINQPLWAMMERREIAKDELVVRRYRQLFEELGVLGIDPAQYNAAYLDNLALKTLPIEGAEELCRFIHQNAVLVVATNGVSATQHRRIVSSGLGKYLDFIIVSDDAGAEKPDSRYFDRAFAVCGAVDKGECIMIGDSLSSDIRGGNDYGMDTCWFNPKGKALPEGAPQPTYIVEKLTDFIGIIQG